MKTTISPRLVRSLAAGFAAFALGLGMAVPAWADELDDQYSEVQQQLSQANAKLEADVTSLANASSALEQSQGQLDYAKAQLAETRRQLAAAQQEDEAAAGRLAQAQNDLEEAKAAVAQGEREVAAQRVEVGNVARTQYQQRTGMVGIGMVVTGESTGDVNNRVQWSTTLLDSTQAELDKLEQEQTRLVAAKDRQARIEEQIAAERARAAANLATRQQLALRAVQEELEVEARVQANAAAQAAASETLTESQRQADLLSAEQTEVETRIRARIAQEEAENLRRAQAERQAREDRETAAARDATRAARQQNEEAARREPPASAPAAEEANPFIQPVQARVTSRYGMRLHPVLKVWKLHDGTDYGASCNTPIRAAADGRVAERYYNAGYGNRLMIDHGRIDGRSMTTGYNHATRYTVNVGQRVEQGEIIGYVGTTGYSTGCHLHLMVWANGKVTNPQTVGF